MKIICEGLDLSEAVLKVSKALPQKSINPILEGIKLVAKGDTLTVSATDLDLSIEKKINADIVAEGEALVPGRFFSEYLRKLTDTTIELTSDEKKMMIKYEDSECDVQCLNVDEYPAFEKIDNADKFLIAEEELADVINKVIFSVSTDDSRPVLKGTLFEIKEYTLTAIALDGYRLAVCKKPLEQPAKEMTAIVPARSLAEISKLVDSKSENVISVYVEKKFIMVDLGHTTITTRLLSGEFINYKQIIPSDFATTMTVNKQLFENTIDRVSTPSRGDKNNLVKFDIKENLLCLVSNSEIANVKANITISLKGKDMSIAFNAKYISDCLKVMDNEFVKMNFTSSVTPCIITPCETDECLYLILPVRMVN